MNSLFQFIIVLLLTGFLCAQNAEGIISHWIFDSEGIVNNVVKDKVSNSDAAIKGGYELDDNGGVAESISLNGTETSLIITEDIGEVTLPKKEMTIEAVFFYRNPISYGGVLAVFQDNGGFEKGWGFGYSGESFAFALSTKGADDGDHGTMTYILSDDSFELMKWYHVAATYNGEMMKLYVNGELQAESDKQSGDINYPGKAYYEIGAYHDDDEYYRIDGKIREIKLYNRALTSGEIKANKEKYNGLLSLKSEMDEREPGLLVKPYLQFATQTEITILWETTRKASSIVEYSEGHLPLNKKVLSDGGKRLHEVKVTGLKPETNYFYSTLSVTENGDTIRSEVSTFKTAVNENTPYAFAVFGDTQNNPQIWGKLADYAWKERPNFALHAGDIVGTGGNKFEWVNEFLNPGNVFMKRYPIYTAIGNHEGDHKNYYKYMANPEPECWYTFTYGNAQFFMIDSNRDLEPGSEQYDWLESELAKSTAKWKFAVHHHPPYSSDENDYGDTYKEESTLGDPGVRHIVPLYEKYGMDIVFNGHIHDYERTWSIKENTAVEEGGVIYVQTGGAGGGLENYAPTRSWFTAKVYRDHHYCMVEVNGGRLKFSAIDRNKRLFDGFEIQK